MRFIAALKKFVKGRVIYISNSALIFKKRDLNYQSMIAVEASSEISLCENQEKIFTDLYQAAFPLVAKFISSRQGTFQDAKDTFQDALVIFYEKLNEDTLFIHESKEAYLLGIAKHLWLRKYNADKAFVSLDTFETSITIPDDYYFPSVESNKLIAVLERTGKKCMELLQAFYYRKLSIAAIMTSFGYGSMHSATVQKFKCLEKVRETIKEKSLCYEDFTE